MGLFDGTSLERPVTCERCKKQLDTCDCAKDNSGKAANLKAMRVRVRREKRRGKWTTIVAGVELEQAALKDLSKKLRTHCGTGGGLTESKEGAELILQGDHKDKAIAFLNSQGFAAKGAGG